MPSQAASTASSSFIAGEIGSPLGSLSLRASDAAWSAASFHVQGPASSGPPDDGRLDNGPERGVPRDDRVRHEVHAAIWFICSS
jgi:hypothetical protein